MKAASSYNLQPLVSIILPVYNGQKYLSESIESVLNQTYKNFELIIIDDGSTDRSAEIIKSYESNKIHYIFSVNGGTASARNLGIRSANGSMLAFLDQDDLWIYSKLQKQVQELSNSIGPKVVFGMVQQFLASDLPIEFKNRFRCQQNPIPGHMPSAMLIETETFHNKVGFFDLRWKLGEWADWFMRFIQSEIPSVMLPDVVVRRRIHSSNKGVTMSGMRKEYIRLLKAGIDRKRAASSI